MQHRANAQRGRVREPDEAGHHWHAIAIGSQDEPASVRFSGVAGHFSTWAVVLAKPLRVNTTLLGNGQLQLSWPGPSAGVLETSTTLAPNSWSSAGSPTQQPDGSWLLEVSTSDPARLLPREGAVRSEFIHSSGPRLSDDQDQQSHEHQDRTHKESKSRSAPPTAFAERFAGAAPVSLVTSTVTMIEQVFKPAFPFTGRQSVLQVCQTKDSTHALPPDKSPARCCTDSFSASPTSTRSMMIYSQSRISRLWAVRMALVAAALFLGALTGMAGTWTPLQHAPPANVQLMLLLPDGTVMAANSGVDNKWYKLTAPDSNGSYVNGSWTNLASMASPRLWYSSVVLRDGRVFVAGGEYPTNGTGGVTAEIYNPQANVWTPVAVPTNVINPSQLSALGGNQAFSDSDAMLLPDGRVVDCSGCTEERLRHVDLRSSGQRLVLGTDRASGKPKRGELGESFPTKAS